LIESKGNLLSDGHEESVHLILHGIVANLNRMHKDAWDLLLDQLLDGTQ